jgi:hypothetical protein
MKCANCGNSFNVVTGGMGNSGPPGQYFIVGILQLLAAVVLAVLGVQIWPWVCLFGGFVMVGWAFEARSECFTPVCPQCKHENTRSIIKPWSL